MVYEVVGQTVAKDGHTYPMARYEHGGDVDVLPEAYVHDSRVLPHQLGGDLAVLFSRAIAAEGLQEWTEPGDWLEGRAAIERSGCSSACAC